ncbi:hypothetical protein DY123_07130 [Apilactobacillus micheneri]|uniref:hypothetical protein n=1 Tax=Apilactobacillus micheneri TaxID=1899430 RepID=UPI00112B5550|nr:hypothetical protein [Apilactobacillus micheneri]TPR41256.1 hypothetical protein DY123_07130 [Apilactobacillus micheneri]
MQSKILNLVRSLEHDYESLTKVPEEEPRLQEIRKTLDYAEIMELDAKDYQYNPLLLVHVCKLLKCNKSYVTIGKELNVSDTVIGRLIKKYGLIENYFEAYYAGHILKADNLKQLHADLYKSPYFPDIKAYPYVADAYRNQFKIKGVSFANIRHVKNLNLRIAEQLTNAAKRNKIIKHNKRYKQLFA